MPTLQVLLACLVLSCSCKASSLIRVHLYDYAGVSGPTLTEAKGYVLEVLLRAGVNIIWADCPAADCDRPVSPEVLQVRIIDRQMASKTSVTKSCLGFALLSGEFSFIASVFYHKAVELERDTNARRAQILGAMLAHEIGHLLLGKGSHSREGIMRGGWEEKDLRTIARGQMWFSRLEAKRLAANAEARVRAVAGRQ